MKLAEALQERADLNRRIEQLRSRLSSNAVVQEGERPAEEPKELLKELDGCTARLEELICRINLTNCHTVVEGKTLTEWIAAKDVLTLQLGIYRNFLTEASQTARRAARTENKILSTVDVKELQKTVDKMARDLRLTDNKIQESNWKTELS